MNSVGKDRKQRQGRTQHSSPSQKSGVSPHRLTWNKTHVIRRKFCDNKIQKTIYICDRLRRINIDICIYVCSREMSPLHRRKSISMSLRLLTHQCGISRRLDSIYYICCCWNKSDCAVRATDRDFAVDSANKKATIAKVLLLLCRRPIDQMNRCGFPVVV